MSSRYPAAVTPEMVTRALTQYQIAASSQQIEQVLLYLKLLLKWNDKVNLTAIRDPLEILHRHFCESMFAAENVPIERGRLADVGSGAGFPGLPLKIMRPELEIFLIESNLKKATFLAEVIRELALVKTRVIVGRYEDLGEELAPLDFVCSRALGDFDAFLKWAASETLAAKRVVLWVGGRDLEEIRRNTLWTWREPVTVPQSLRRYLLVGERNP
ncbi:MAG: 16S rRNA (guanine(527)-N(7))-methyltransferase RsmG [Acidobacteriia bacterium]|nr:16S rRNA (guanine(527)-N(7))-methyltransferase RsmG [Terriglobia bacterium]